MAGSWGVGRELGGAPWPPSPALAPGRVTLRRMPSIRQTLREMGVKVSDIFPELGQSRGSGLAGPRNGTAPTLLTNYLDVSLALHGGLSPHHGPTPHNPTRCTPTVHLLPVGSGLTLVMLPNAIPLPDPVFWRDQHWNPRPDLQGGLRHGLGQPVGAILQVLPPLQRLR